MDPHLDEQANPDRADPADSDLDELRTVVRGFLARACPPATVRRLMADPAEHDAVLWRRLATELGLTGLAIEEEFGGAGCGMAELAVVCEELGRTLAPVPYLATAVLAAYALPTPPNPAKPLDPATPSTPHAPPDQHDIAAQATARIKTGIADGSVIATVVLEGDLRSRDGRLTGTADLVLDGHLADVVICAADGDLYTVDGDAPGLTRVPLVGFDQTRRLAALRFESTPAIRLGNDEVLPRLRDLAVTALAAEQVGGAQRCLEMALEQARTRVQFGRTIGSFQAIKHKLADMLVRVESARSAMEHAARLSASTESFETWVGVAGSYCSEAYLFVAGENIQIHGGIGVTWEHDAHLHFKRATSAARLFGRPEDHRARLAGAAGLR